MNNLPLLSQLLLPITMFFCSVDKEKKREEAQNNKENMEKEMEGGQASQEFVC